MIADPYREHRQGGIVVKTMYHKPDGSCSYTITFPCSVVEGWARDYDCSVTICALLEVMGLAPDQQWHSMHDISKNVWRIWGEAHPIYSGPESTG